MWTHHKDGIMAVTVEIFWLRFCMFTCVCPMVISSIFGKSFHFPFPYFVLLYFIIHFIHRCFQLSFDTNLFNMYVCSQTFILFWLRKTSMSAKKYQLSFCVFICVSHVDISSFFFLGESFPFLFIFFSFHFISLC